MIASTTSGYPPEEKQGFPKDLAFVDFADDGNCYDRLVDLLHPHGLGCPRCKANDGLRIHRRHREPVVDYICLSCFRVFNAWTATVLQGVHRPPGQILYIVNALLAGESSAAIARAMGCNRRGVTSLRLRLLPILREFMPRKTSRIPRHSASRPRAADA